jgi:NAD(P)-dependent dehydrogenase (short-subunit alcohol dehydrogenase family)
MTASDAKRRWALVTGGTDGIGKAIASRLARRGAGVIVVGSDAEKGRSAARQLRAESTNDQVHFVQADLALMRNVEALAEVITLRWPSLHYLVHSAGVVRGHYVLSEEGIESNFAISYLSRFLLTQLLLPALASTGTRGHKARILVVSGALRDGVVRFEDVNLTRRFSTLAAVAQFCGANDLFVVEQARRIDALGVSGTVSIVTLKVGAARTNIRKEFPLWMKLAVALLLDPFMTLPADAIAASAEQLLLAPEFENESGSFFVQIKQMKPAAPGRRTLDPNQAHRLWDLSERLVAGAVAGRLHERHGT